MELCLTELSANGGRRAGQIHIVRHVTYTFNDVEANIAAALATAWEVFPANGDNAVFWPVFRMNDRVDAGHGREVTGRVLRLSACSTSSHTEHMGCAEERQSGLSSNSIKLLPGRCA